MIIWINGAFGAGKTTLAIALAGALEPSILFDPELAGLLLQRTVPPAPSGDFQDLPVWRDLVVSIALSLRRRYGGALIVPMTLVAPDYRREIFGALRSAGESLLHVFLDVDAATLRQRIEAHVIAPLDPVRDAEIRAWRLAQTERCLQGREFLPPDTLFLDAATMATPRLAEAVIASLATRSDGAVASCRSNTDFLAGLQARNCDAKRRIDRKAPHSSAPSTAATTGEGRK